MMSVLILACGDTPVMVGAPWIEVTRVPARPGKADVDPLLDRLGERRLVVTGTDADLAAVVLRLLRTERLASVQVGFVPVLGESSTPRGTKSGVKSGVAAVFDLPTESERALKLALHGEPDPVPLIRDDAGGVLVGLGELGPVRGVAYCDDTRVLRGQAARLEVSPDPTAGPDTSADGLLVRVWRGGLFRRGPAEFQGRAVQIGCAAAPLVRNGVPHEEPVRRWTWYRHTTDLRLVRGLL